MAGHPAKTTPECPPARPLRLAVYGFIEEQAGSLAGANYQILRELLDRGHRVDLYAIGNFVTPGRLAGHMNLRYIPYTHPPSEWVWRRVERVSNATIRATASQLVPIISTRAHYSHIGELIRINHRNVPYDALLVVGLLSPWKLMGSLTVSWTQGCPVGEGGWILANSMKLIRYGAAHLLPALYGLYALKTAEALFDIRNSDYLICGSRWAQGSWRRLGVPTRKTIALPYPIDLDFFRTYEHPLDKPSDEVLFLHFGRLVPRKRLDLLLRSFARVVRKEPAARLLIVGGFSYADGYRRLFDRADLMKNVEYRASVPRADVPGLLARADIVIQPSENENFGSSIAEGIASGRAVVLGPSNGTQDYVGSTAVLFQKYTPKSVAAGMQEAIQRVRTNRAGILIDGRAAAERSFRIQTIVDKLELLLRGRLGVCT